MLLILALALAPRLVGLEQHLTADDQDWVQRVARFGRALGRGDLAATYQSGHPGVTVLWLAALAFGPERTAELAARSGDATAARALTGLCRPCSTPGERWPAPRLP